MTMMDRRSFLIGVVALSGVGCKSMSRGSGSTLSTVERPASLVEDLAFTASCDGTLQRYMLIRPVHRTEHALIALHGHGADRRQFALDSRDECRAARDVAARHGMLFVSPDYRAPTSWMGPKAEADVVQLIKILKRREGIRRVFVCGASMGGSSALTFTVLHPNLVAGVTAMNGTANHVVYTNFQEAIAQSFGGTKDEAPQEYRKRSAELYPERLTMPVAITAGGKDTLVPPDSVVRLATALKDRRHDVLLIYREEGGHSTNYADASKALEFLVEKASRH